MSININNISIEWELQNLLSLNINFTISVNEIKEQITFIINENNNYEFKKSKFKTEFKIMNNDNKKFCIYLIDLYFRYNRNVHICKFCGSCGTNSSNCPKNPKSKKTCLISHYKMNEFYRNIFD